MSAGGLVSFMLYQQSLSSAFSMMGDVFSALTAAVGAADKVRRCCTCCGLRLCMSCILVCYTVPACKQVLQSSTALQAALTPATAKHMKMVAVSIFAQLRWMLHQQSCGICCSMCLHQPLWFVEGSIVHSKRSSSGAASCIMGTLLVL
jgi:hypothetical protein